MLSSANDINGMPREGKNLIVVAAVRDRLHVRIFDAQGKIVVDTPLQNLTGKLPEIEALKHQLETWWPPHELTANEKRRLIAQVTSIVWPRRFSSWAFSPRNSELQLPHQTPVIALAYRHDSQALLTLTTYGTLQAWDTAWSGSTGPEPRGDG